MLLLKTLEDKTMNLHELSPIFKDLQQQELTARQSMASKLSELQKLKTKTTHQKALILLFSACLNQDKDYDDTDRQSNDIKMAGNMIYQEKGMNGLHSNYIWDSMPKSMYRVVDCLWDGIGDWRG